MIRCARRFCQRSDVTKRNKVHVAGQPWTGALGLGEDVMLLPDVSPDERDNSFQQLNDPLLAFDSVTDAAAGWGHSILIHDSKLYVAGRPYDFQSLLRLNRIPSFVRRTVIGQSLKLEKKEEWGFIPNAIDLIFRRGEDESYQNAIYPKFQEIKLPDEDVPMPNTDNKTLAASAGLSAIVGSSGKVYTFGNNQKGQCGVGDKNILNCWQPTAVISVQNEILSNIKSVDLGLQHGLALDGDGMLYGWGKGARGQLGIAEYKDPTKSDEMESAIDVEYHAVEIKDFFVPNIHSTFKSRLHGSDSNVKKISTGWNHSAVVTDSNHVFIWGKNVLRGGGDKNARDAFSPTCVHGLPQTLKVIDVSCGSHHTAILMEDGSIYGTGLATDTVQPIGLSAVQMIPSGLIKFPIRQFTSHFDRTTIVSESKENQVLEVQLWSTEALRSTGVFEPQWVETILSESDRVKMIHRGWQHTIAITD